MSDLKLFRTTSSGVAELPSGAMALERSLQTLFETNLEALLGVRFLASDRHRKDETPVRRRLSAGLAGALEGTATQKPPFAATLALATTGVGSGLTERPQLGQ